MEQIKSIAEQLNQYCLHSIEGTHHFFLSLSNKDEVRAQILNACRQITQILNQKIEQPSSPDDEQLLLHLMTILIEPENCAQANLWNDDDTVMAAVAAIYQHIPPQDVPGVFVAHLLNYFSQAGNDASVRSKLAHTILQGPKDHWKEQDLQQIVNLAQEMSHDLHEQRSIAVINDLLSTFYEMSQSSHLMKESKTLLHELVAGLIYENSIQFYTPMLNKIDGATLVRLCIKEDKYRGDNIRMNNLDNVVSDDMLAAWFPKNNARTEKLAAHYPRLKAMMDRRALEREIEGATPATPSRLPKM